MILPAFGLAPLGVGLRQGKGFSCPGCSWGSWRPVSYAGRTKIGDPQGTTSCRLAVGGCGHSGRGARKTGVARVSSGHHGALCGPEPPCVSPQVLEFAGTLSAHAQHLLLALCHFLLPGHGDSKSLLWPGAWVLCWVAGGEGLPGCAACWRRGCLLSHLWSSPGTGVGGLGRDGSVCPLPSLHFCLFLQEEAVGPWYHLSAQEIQPLFGEHRLEGDGRGWVKMHCCLEDAWNGGSSLLIRGLIPPEVGNVSVR